MNDNIKNVFKRHASHQAKRQFEQPNESLLKKTFKQFVSTIPSTLNLSIFKPKLNNLSTTQVTQEIKPSPCFGSQRQSQNHSFDSKILQDIGNHRFNNK